MDISASGKADDRAFSLASHVRRHDRRVSPRWPQAASALVGICALAASPAHAVTSYTITQLGLLDAGHTNGSTGEQYNHASFLNAAGQVAGDAQRYNESNYAGTSAWFFNGSSTQQIGLIDAGHTNSITGRQFNFASFLNAAGQVAGDATRYNGSNYAGQSVWFFNGSSTRQIGMIDAGHTNSSTGEQNNFARSLNAAGQVVGYASRYNGSISAGTSAWFFNGTSTQQIGLVDAGHTNSITGEQYNRVSFFNVLNAAGQVVGYASRHNGSIWAGTSAWFFNGSSTQQIGLVDARHTNSITGKQSNYPGFLNAAGQVLGSAQRFNGSNDAGQSVWFFNGSSTHQIGLIDAGHTKSIGGYQFNQADFLNAAGQVAGYAERYNGSNSTGRSAWFFSGSSTQQIGLIDAGHTNSSSGQQFNVASFLNAAGQVAGYAMRYNGSNYAGASAWFFSGSSTQQIGLVDAGHTNSSTGEQGNSPAFLSAAGQVAGTAQRYNGSNDAGISAWFFNGSGTRQIGLVDAGHTDSSTGFQYNNPNRFNAAGQVAGTAERYNGSISAGESAWFFDPTTNTTFNLDGSISISTGYANSMVQYLGENGLALGYYEFFNSGGVSQGNRAFSFTVADGWNDLGSLVDGGLNASGWSPAG